MIALVTGGTRGIGLACVRALKAAGHTVAVVARGAYCPDDCDYYIRADLSVLLDRIRIFNRIMDTLGGIDILVNNAGVQYEAPALQYEHSKWNEQIELLLSAPFDLCQMVAPYMIQKGHGRIINMASVAGVMGTRGIIAYSVAKAGLIEMTKCLSNEWLSGGITVNAIAPGFIDTGMQDPTRKEAMLGRIPAARYGTPQEVADAVVWLASDAARYISGIVLPIDGGWMAR